MNKQWKKIISEQVGEVLAVEELQPESAEWFDPEKRPDALVHELASAKLWTDAFKTASRSLPPREAVWWACMCTRQMATLAADETEMEALKAAEDWVFKPEKEYRFKAFEFAQKCESQSAGMLAALAAAFSSNTLPLVDGTEAELDGTVFSEMVAATVMISVSDAKPSQFRKRYRMCIASADDIATGGNGRVWHEEVEG